MNETALIETTKWPSTNRKAFALALNEMGFAVFPLYHIKEDGACSCSRPDCKEKNRGKHPRTTNGCKDATQERMQVEDWWDMWPEANIGIATGQVWELVVLDQDGPDGAEHRKEWMGDVETLSVTTGKDFGEHFYFLYKGRVKSGTNIFPQTDIRGEGGYVIGPGSNHYSGRTYKWNNVAPLAELPDAVVRADIEKTHSDKSEPIDWGKKLTEGERDVQLTRHAGQLIGKNKMDAKTAFPMLYQWNKNNCEPPLEKQQVLKIVLSIANRESEKEKRFERPSIVEETGKFELISFKEATKIYRPVEQRWNIENWLPVSTCGLIGALPEMYKTWFILDMALSVATGKPFLCQYPVGRRSPVIIVQQEDPMHSIMERMAIIMNFGEPTYDEETGTFFFPKVVDELPIYFHTTGQLNVMNPDTIRQLEAHINFYGAGLVLADPLYSMIPLKDHGAEAAPLMMPFKRIRDRTGCSFMFVHHHTKQNSGGRLRDNLHGSVFLSAWIETGFQFGATDEKNKFRIERHGKALNNLKDVSVQFDIQPYNYYVDCQEEGTSEMFELNRLKQLLTQHPCKTQKEIAEKMKTSVTWVSRALTRIGVTRKVNGFYYYQPIPTLDSGTDE